MNKSESKYFATAAKMDEAFMALLEKKDFAYITVKELCETAGVNRSTFYLHYETVNDLLAESVERMTEQFVNYMKKDTKTFITKLQDCPMEELYLITPEYLTPYLHYVREYKRLFRTQVEHAETLGLDQSYERLFRYVFTPILERFRVPEKERGYLMAFYIHGIMAMIEEWLRKDCADPVEEIIAMMQRYILQPQGKVF